MANSFFADEGTAAHMLASRCLLDGSDAGDHVGTSITTENYYHARLNASGAERWMACPLSAAPRPKKPLDEGSTFEVTDEMAEAVQVYLDYVRETLANTPHADLLVEHSFDLKAVHPEAGGTCDAIIVQPFGRIEVIDYKHGAGRAVDVFDNTQLKYYGLGALMNLCEVWSATEVVITIVQPRVDHRDGPVRSYPKERGIDPTFLLDWGNNELKPAAAKTDAAEPEANPGDHCHWCPKLEEEGVCPGIFEKIEEVALVPFEDQGPQLVPPPPHTLTPEQLAKALDFASMISTWSKSVYAYASNQAAIGRLPPGYKLVTKLGHRAWADTEKVLESVKDKTILYAPPPPPKLRSPAQLETELKKKLKPKEAKALVDSLAIRPETTVLVPITDSRPGLTTTTGFAPVDITE
jgi:hypothetical protein